MDCEVMNAKRQGLAREKFINTELSGKERKKGEEDEWKLKMRDGNEVAGAGITSCQVGE